MTRVRALVLLVVLGCSAAPPSKAGSGSKRCAADRQGAAWQHTHDAVLAACLHDNLLSTNSDSAMNFIHICLDYAAVAANGAHGGCS